MKFQTIAIAIAIASTTAVPAIVNAKGSLYASARIGLELVDTNGTSDLNVVSQGSFFGVRGETSLGKGMTGFGRFEWDVDLIDEESFGNLSEPVQLRHRYVGLKADFGTLTIGHTHHSYYNLVYGPTDSPWSGSEIYYPSPSRSGNGITVSGKEGKFTYSGTAYFERDANEDSPDGAEVAISFPVKDMTLAIGIRTVADSAVDDVATVAYDESDVLKGAVLHGLRLGDATIGVGIQFQDNVDSIVAEALIGNAYAHFEAASTNTADPKSLTLGYTQSLGSNTTAWFEFISADADSGVSNEDNTTVRAILKYDIL